MNIINQSAQAHNPWVVKPPAQAAVPIGMYFATFMGVEDHTLPTGEARWRWAWTIKTGEHTGKVASALTNREISPNALPGRLIVGLLGRQLQAGENIQASVDACKGQPYMVGVEPGPKGGKPGVRSCSKPPAM